MNWPQCPACDWSGCERCIRSDCPIRAWQLEFDSDGDPFTWRGNAANEKHAEQRARFDLARVASFDCSRARVIACLQR